jgi:hypothetical protein
MSLTATLVVTTIHELIVLEDYLENFDQFDHLEQVSVYVIPDRRTPPAAYQRCQDLHERGLKIACPTLDEQENYLNKVGFPPELIPYNSDNRRNVGYLMALEAGSDFVISIDDDNHCCRDEDYFLAHAIVCEQNYLANVVNAETGWFNTCSLLELDRTGTTYPRGFPYYARHKSYGSSEFVESRADVHINAGLWLLDPDIDGISWLVAPAQVVSFTGQSLVLGEHTWSPVNTQNTALRRDAIAAYYFVKMGYPLAGTPIDRYGDILSGYFVQACARHLGGAVRVGTPIVEHRRTSHDYMKDAANEWACIMVLEDMLPWLVEVKLEGTTYPEVYTSLSYALEDMVERTSEGIWTDPTRGYFHQVSYYMRTWAKVCASLL